MLFQGELIHWPAIPAHYIPTWLAITTPPGVLLLSLIGAAGVLWRTLTHPGELLRNPTTRFEGLLAACVLLPVGAVIVLNANVHNGWRQMYFLYAPLCVLAVAGLRRLAGVCRWPALRAGVYGLAVAGLAGVVIEMVGIHPHQYIYFNRLVDRSTPEYLRGQYGMDYWRMVYREGLEYLLQHYPASPISLVPDRPRGRPGFQYTMNRDILPKADRRRLVFADGMEEEGDFYVTSHVFTGWGDRFDHPFAPVVYTRQVYNNTILTVSASDPALVDAATVERYRQLYRATTAGPPLLRSAFDLYLDGTTLTWVKAPCRPADVRGRFVVHVVPVDPAAAAGRPGWRWRPNLGQGWDRQTVGPAAGRLAWRWMRGFIFSDYGVRVDGACLLRPLLPPYAIQTLEARLIAPGGVDRWHVALAWSAAGVRATDLLEARYRAVVAAPPVARSAFALYLEGRTLTYVKEGCQRADTRGRFFLHVFPRDRAVLAAAQRSLGFAVLDFSFHRRHLPHVQQAARFADKCLATVRLPAYPLARLRTGQVASEKPVWAVEFPVADQVSWPVPASSGARS